MDYGKMAYLKAEELEARLLTPTAKQGARLIRGRPFQPLGEGITLVSYERGGFAVIAKLTINSSGGTVYLTAGGMRAAQTELTAGRSQNTLLLLTPAGKGEIGLNGENCQNAVLESYELLTVGDVPEIKESGQGGSFAGGGSAYALVSGEDNDLDMVVTDSKFVKSADMAVGRGPYADVCAAQNGFYVVYSDVCGLLWGVFADYGLNVVSRNFLGEAVGRVSTVCYGDTVYVFFVKEGAAHYFSTRVPYGVRGQSFKVDFNAPVQAVTAVGGASPPAVAVESGGKVYLLKAETEQVKRETLKVRVRGWKESV